MAETSEINYTPLTEPVRTSDLKAVSSIPYFLLAGADKIKSVVFACVLFLVLGVIFDTNSSATETIAIIIWMLVFVTIVSFVALYSEVKSLRTAVKLGRFAQANNLVYEKDIHDPVLSGMIFDEGDSRSIIHRLSGKLDGTVFELANYQYATGSGKNRQTHDYGYAKIMLSRQLPHMVLDAKKNNGFGITNLPDTFNRGQKLELEGNFNEHFTLYCPKEYERDALYVFTPDLMALLIDNANAFDIEIVDNQLYLYQSKQFELTSREQFEKLFHIFNTIGTKVERQTDYYADERINDRTMNVVAQPGRRLKKSLSIQAVIVFLVIAYYLYMVSRW